MSYRRLRAILFAALLAAPLFLAARLVDNCRHPDGTPVLVPEPQRYEARRGALALPAEFTVSAPKEAANEVEVFRSLVRRSFPKRTVRQVGNNAFLRLELVKEGVPDSDEGYTLEVGDAAVTVRARTTHGLFYGVQTLGNLFRNAAEPEIGRCLITDWPDIETRGVYFERVVTRGHKSMPHLLRAFDLLGALKYNAVVLELGEFFPYKENPFTLRKTSFLPEDIAALNAAAKRNHLEIMPYLQIISHDKWMQAHPRYWQEIAEGIPPETPWSSASCPLKPLPRKIFKMAIKEQIEAFRPRTFLINLDEIAQCPWGVCELCRKHSRYELLKLATLEYTKEVLKYGVAPVLAHDQYYPGLPMGGERILPELDRRVVINIWNYGEVVNSALFEYFSKTGLPLAAWSSSLNIGNLRSLPRMAKKFGVKTVIVSHWGNWRVPDIAKNAMPGGLAGFADGANYTWNLSAIAPAGQSFDPARETLRICQPDAVVEPREYRYFPLSLDAAFNAKLGRERAFPLTDAKLVRRLREELLAAPEHFRFMVSPDGGYFAVKAGKGEGETPKIEIPLRKSRVDVLSFLLTAGVGSDTPTLRRLPIGAITIRYADGKTKAVPLVLWSSITHWNAPASGARIRFVERFNDTRGALAGFFALDWKNPRPSAPITAIALEADGTYGMPIALFAVTAGRRADAADAAKLPLRRSAHADVAARLTEWSRGIHERSAGGGSAETVVMPLDRGIPARTKIALAGKSDGRLVKTLIDDPTAPVPGKALRLDIPPNAKGEKQRQRLVIDAFFDRAEAPKEIKTLIFDYKIADNDLIFIPACYLTGPAGTDLGALRMMPFANRLAPARRWYTVKVPVDRMTVEGKKIADKDISRVRLSIFFNVHDKPTTVWFGPVRLSSQRQSLPPTLRGEQVPEENVEIPPPTVVAL